MNEECNDDCSTCSKDCDSRKETRDMRIPSGPFSDVGKVIAVASGKGGVGKSLVTALLASAMRARGNACAVLDADATGPSVPKSFGIKAKAEADDRGLLPAESRTGVKIMSVNLLLDAEESPVVWRGPLISGVVRQFWKDVVWGRVDYMFVDMPPGTGDVALTVFQNLPVDGAIIVTTPQDLASMIVKKAFNMTKLMNIPVLGIVENMSRVVCPDCGREIKLFGESRADEMAAEFGVPVLAKIPIDPKIAELVDKGEVEAISGEYVAEAVELLSKTNE